MTQRLIGAGLIGAERAAALAAEIRAGVPRLGQLHISELGAVVGAHLSGMALNCELKALGGRLLEAATTAPDYRLYALPTTPPKPGNAPAKPPTANATKVRPLAPPAPP